MSTNHAESSGIMRGMTNPKIKPALVPVLVLFTALLVASCRRPEPAVCPLVPFSGPFTCEVSTYDAQLPCIVCLKTTCCAEMTACDHEDATCGCLFACRINKKMSQEKCASHCPAPNNPTYPPLATCIEKRCDMCPQEHG